MKIIKNFKEKIKDILSKIRIKEDNSLELHPQHNANQSGAWDW